MVIRKNIQEYKDLFAKLKADNRRKYKTYEGLLAAYQLLTDAEIDWKFTKGGHVEECKYFVHESILAHKYAHAYADDPRIYDLYWDFLKWEAPLWLDSYCLFIEKDRPPKERFYAPRRKTLIKVVDVLQRLEDDELDEAFIHMPARVGKLLADDTPVLTSDGWKNHGDLKLGDRVIGSDGKYTTILCVHPKYHTTHTVTLSDGSKFDCHYRHEWTVFDRRSNRWRTVETQKLIGHLHNGDRNNFILPERPILEGEQKDLMIHPYVMGAWLGDGTNRQPRITGAKEDFPIIQKIESMSYKVAHTYTHKATGVMTYAFGSDVADGLRSYGLCKRGERVEKHIPEDFLGASVEQRLELLAGLLDTDGCLIRKERRYQFTTAEERLKDDFCELIASFGWRTSVTEVKPKTSSSGIKGKRTYWVIGFNPTMFIPCALHRKQLHEYSKQKRLSIADIQPSEHKTGNCITVSNTDGIYLVGKNLIPTHNTQIITLGMAWHCSRHPELANLYCSYKEDAGGAFLDGVKEILTDPIYCHKEAFPKCRIVSTDAKANTIDLNRKKKYKSLSGKGLTSGLNGLYDANGWLVADDVLEGIQDVLNPTVLERKQQIFDNNLMKRKKENCKVIYNGTIWSLHDIFMNRQAFLENNPEAQGTRWEILKIPALDPDTDESNFDYDYGVGFSTKYYRMERAKFEENDDMASWFSQCQQEPIEREGAVFNPEHMSYYNGVLPNEEPLKIVAACDVALGGGDYLSMPIAYVYTDGSIYIHDVVYDNSEKEITQPMVVDALIQNGVTTAFFESNVGGLGYKDDIDRLLKEKGVTINLESKYAQQMILSTGGSTAKSKVRKEQRIWDSAGDIRRFIFRQPGSQSAMYRKFMNNVYGFTINGRNLHDDAPDSLASLNVFLKRWTGAPKAQIVSSLLNMRR